jgi:CheY-like chemotaxis protein
MAALILALLEDHDSANQVKACLEDSGHSVFVVNSFQKALALLSAKKIDLIVSDVHLENGGSVFDFLRAVKKGQWTCEIPFVLFSLKPTPLAKYLADGIRTTARHLGAIKYIEMETFDAAQFQEQINVLLPLDKQVVDIDKRFKIQKTSE